MTPEYHYAVAESILAQADGNDDLTLTEAGVLFARAQVHATLGSVDMNGAEIKKLRAENARLVKVIDEKIASLNEVGEWESCAQETLDRIEKVLDEGAGMSEYWQVTEIEQIVALWNAKMDKK